MEEICPGCNINMDGGEVWDCCIGTCPNMTFKKHHKNISFGGTTMIVKSGTVIDRACDILGEANKKSDTGIRVLTAHIEHLEMVALMLTEAATTCRASALEEAATVCDTHASMAVYNLDEKNVALSCADKIRALKTPEGVAEGCKKAATGRGAP